MRGSRKRDGLGTDFFRYAPSAVATAPKLQTQRFDSIFDFIHAPIVALRCKPVETGSGEHLQAIKTGCRFESHQLEDIKGLLLALVIESAIAWQILRLRHVARSQPSAPGRNLLTRPQFETLNRLRALRGQPTDNLSVQQVIDELARLGVHLRNNGPPGWAVLKRGLRKLNLLSEGLCLADPAIPTEM